MSATVVAALLFGSLVAGWVDAVVGGGGLILIPLIMILTPSLSNAQALGVNKVAAIFGTGSSALTLMRKVPSARKAFRYAPLALVGAAGGALIASVVDKQVMRPIIIVVLVLVGVFILFRPTFGMAQDGAMPSRRATIAIVPLIMAIGVYDGVFGPGTGLFLILSISTLLKEEFLTGAAWAKVINTFTNLGALITFSLQGEILWALGLGLAVTNVIGAQIGARMVLGKGSGFIRVVILVVVVLMSTKLLLDQFGVGAGQGG